MRRRNLYPMPIEGLIDHPQAMALPAAAYGMLCRLCYHFWAIECRPLPKSQDELRSIARAHLPTWRRWNAEILKVFEEIRPELERYYQWRESRGSTIRMVGARGRAVRDANRRREAFEKSQSAFPPIMVPRRSQATRHKVAQERFHTNVSEPLIKSGTVSASEGFSDV